jgi:hypothetical protein
MQCAGGRLCEIEYGNFARGTACHGEMQAKGQEAQDPSVETPLSASDLVSCSNWGH